MPANLIPPDELPDDEFPLVLTTGRVLEHWHTGAMTRRATVLDQLEPEPVVSINPYTMGEKGLAPGDRVKVETRRGEIELPKGADRDTAEKAALDDPGVARSLEGLNVRKVIVVPDRIVNIVAG